MYNNNKDRCLNLWKVLWTKEQTNEPFLTTEKKNINISLQKEVSYRPSAFPAFGTEKDKWLFYLMALLSEEENDYFIITMYIKLIYKKKGCLYFFKYLYNFRATIMSVIDL